VGAAPGRGGALDARRRRFLGYACARKRRPAGHGRSEGSPRALVPSVELLVDDALAALRWCRVRRSRHLIRQAQHPGAPVALLGSSLGGLVALSAARRAAPAALALHAPLLRPARDSDAPAVVRAFGRAIAAVAPGLPVTRASLGRSYHPAERLRRLAEERADAHVHRGWLRAGTGIAILCVPRARDAAGTHSRRSGARRRRRPTRRCSCSTEPTTGAPRQRLHPAASATARPRSTSFRAAPGAPGRSCAFTRVRRGRPRRRPAHTTTSCASVRPSGSACLMISWRLQQRRFVARNEGRARGAQRRCDGRDVAIRRARAAAAVTRARPPHARCEPANAARAVVRAGALAG
jgi:hypothetical protein